MSELGVTFRPEIALLCPRNGGSQTSSSVGATGFRRIVDGQRHLSESNADSSKESKEKSSFHIFEYAPIQSRIHSYSPLLLTIYCACSCSVSRDRIV